VTDHPVTKQRPDPKIFYRGYETVDHFALPPSSWWEDYYGPLQQNLTEFRERHRNEPDAQQLADQVQCEIDVWHAYSDFYSYEFFVMRVL
jgi:hypothetical protein